MTPKSVSQEKLEEAILGRGKDGRRVVVAVAGPPGTGKSTFSDALEESLDRRQPGSTAVFPMDGFHYDDRILDAGG